MIKILGNMKSQWKAVLLIVVLLFVQAVCDLKLPDYTSDLIDVGIMNSGIEYAVPKTITSEDYTAVSLFMTEDEKSLWQSSYEIEDDGFYHLKDESTDNLKELDDHFTTPLAITYMVTSSKQSQMGDHMQAGQMGGDGSMTSMEDVRGKIEEALKTMGDSIVHSSAVAFVSAEYDKTSVDTSGIQSGYLWRTGGKMIGITLLMAVAAIIVGYLASKVGAGVGRELREKVFKKVVSFSNDEINKFSTASLITRTTNDIQQVQMVSTILLRMLLYAPILAIGGIIMVIRTNAGMEWIIIVAVAAVLCLVSVLMVVAMPKFKAMQKLVDKVNLVSREILTGISVIRAFGREKEEEKRFDEANVDLTKTMLFTNRVMTFMFPIMTLVMYGVSILIVWVAADKIDNGRLEVGAMTAFITYTMMIIMSFLMITMMSIMLPRAAVAAGRINEIIETEPTIVDKKKNKDEDVRSGLVQFSDVSFRYEGADDNVLSNITFTARPGKTTAIIGSTGCGKSTLVNLIPRLYDVTEGSITIDGIDIRDLSQKKLRENIGFVPQKGVLFSGTIASNLRFGDKDASEAELTEAADIAQATEFISAKAEGLESFISQGGGNVSGGQKQRLSIARAIVKKPAIYIFDDSFSALDFKTDVALRKALGPKVKDSTVIIVAQRISTVLNADQILVLDDGILVGSGTHKELMEHCDVYKEIAASQLSEKEIAASLGKEVASNE